MLNFTNATLCLLTSPCVSLEESFAETTTEFKNQIIVFTNTVTNVHHPYDPNLFSSHSAHLSRRRTATILHNTRACYEARSFFTLLVIFMIMLTIFVIFSTIMLTRARVHRTTVEALQGPDTLNCLLVTPPPWDRLRALGQGCPLIKIPKTFLQTTVLQHNSKVHRVKSSQCAGRTQCTSTATPTLDRQPGPPLFQAQATTGCLSINCVQRRSEHCAIFSK